MLDSLPTLTLSVQRGLPASRLVLPQLRLPFLATLPKNDPDKCQQRAREGQTVCRKIRLREVGSTDLQDLLLRKRLTTESSS